MYITKRESNGVIIILNVLLIIIVVLLFGLIIFIHELGHFVTAKLSGITVHEFAIGMGPTLIHFQKGETKYALRLLPIGGFCAMEGEDEESDDPGAFGNKPVWKRILVVIMGGVMNIVLGLVLMIILLAQQPAFSSTTVAQFMDSASSQATGLQVGDQFLSVDGYKILSQRDLSYALATAEDFTLDMEVLRNGEKVTLKNVTFASKEQDGQKILQLDFYVAPIEKNLGTLLHQAGAETVSTVRMVWSGLAGLVTGRYGLNDMAGPVGAADVIGQAVSVGLETNFLEAFNNLLMIMVIITVNLGIVNLLPLPALDGGRLVFLIVEAIRRKPVPAKYEGWVHAAGFALLIGLMLLVTFSDVLRIATGSGLGG